VEEFVLNIVNKIKKSKTKGIFYALNVKEHRELIDEAITFVDKTIDLSK